MPANDLAAALAAVRLARAHTPAQLPALPLAEPLAVPAPAPDHPNHRARASIWADQRAGLISIAEAQRRSAALDAPPPPELELTAPSVPRQTRPSAPPRPRHDRPAPRPSRQYAQAMATTAARDDRLTPQAKAFLQFITARCGKGRETTLTKGTAGNVMSRSPRTIRRYLVDLIRFGYIEAETRTSARGMHTGLVVRITDLVRPFYEEAKGLAAWLAEKPAALFRPFEGIVSPGKQGVSLLTPKNQPSKNLLLGDGSGGRWRAGLALAEGKQPLKPLITRS